MAEVLESYLHDEPDPVFYVTVHSIRYRRRLSRVPKSRLKAVVKELIRQQLDFSVTRYP